MERVASVNTKENHNPSNSVRQSLKSKKSFETGNNLRSSTQDLFPTTCYVIRPQSKQ